MSKALKCDRCGIYYCDNNYNVKGSKGNTVVGIGLLLRGTGIGVDHFVGMKKMDLCDGCLKKLEDFMNINVATLDESLIGVKFVDHDETGLELKCTKCNKSYYAPSDMPKDLKRIPPFCSCGNALRK